MASDDDKQKQLRTAFRQLAPNGIVPEQVFKRALTGLVPDAKRDDHILQAMLEQSGGRAYNASGEACVNIDQFFDYLFEANGYIASCEKKDFSMRAVTLGDVLNLFTERCGTIYFERSDEAKEKPICKPYKLAMEVASENLVRMKKKAAGELTESDLEGRTLRTDLYAVVSLIIKPLTARPGQQPPGVSLSEHYHKAGLTVKYFISHYWGEDFGEFVQSLFRFALVEVRDPNLSAEDLHKAAKALQLYICAFSNNQHNISDELRDGMNIKETPFYVALAAPTTTKVILNLDTQITALQRAWCVFEFKLTFKEGKKFFLNTYLGPLSRLALESEEEVNWLEHMFGMLDVVDLEQAQATNPDDRKMILKHVKEDGEDAVQSLHLSLKQRISTAVLPMLAKAGQLDQVKRALNNKADVNQPDTMHLSALTYAQANADYYESAGEAARGKDPKEIVQALLAKEAAPLHQKVAGHLVQMFDKESRVKRLKAIEQVQRFVDSADEKTVSKGSAGGETCQAEYHGKALALAERLDLELEATHQVAILKRTEDADQKAGALRRLIKTGRAGLRHVDTIVHCLVKKEYDEDGKVCDSAVEALHSLGSNAAHLAIPHLMKLIENDDRELVQVLQVLQNFGVAIPRAFEGQVNAAVLRLQQQGVEQGKKAARVLYGCDTRFCMRQRLFPTPPQWDWGPEQVCRPLPPMRPNSPCPRPGTRHGLGSAHTKSADKLLPTVERARQFAGTQVGYFQVYASTESAEQLQSMWPKTVDHLAIDLRHSSTAPKESLECTLEVAQRAQQELVADLDFCDWVNCFHLRTVVESVGRLSKLYLNAGGVRDLEDQKLLDMAKALPEKSNLKSLSLSLGTYAGIFTDQNVWQFSKELSKKIQGWHNLTSLAVSLASGAEKISAGAIAPLVNIKDGLEEVHLGLPVSTAVNDRMFAVFGVVHFEDKERDQGEGQAHTSEGRKDSGQQSKPAEVDAICLPASLRALSLDFGASSQITDAGAKALINTVEAYAAKSNGPRLRQLGLNLHAASQVSNAVLDSLAGLAASSVEKRKEPMRHLQLDLGSADLMDEGLNSLAKTLGADLEVLCIDARQSVKLTWDSMVELNKTIRCAQGSLTRLSLDFGSFGANENFSSRDAYDINTLFPGNAGQAGEFSELCSLHLNFSQCMSITDAGVQELCSVLPEKLAVLDLDFAYNSKLTEAPLMKLGEKLQELLELSHLSLNFRAAETVTDDGVLKLAHGLKKLVKLKHFNLNLHTAANISDEAVHKLADAFESTQFLEMLVLDFFNSNGITNLRQLATSLQNLQYLLSMTVHAAHATLRDIEELQQELKNTKGRSRVTMNYTANEQNARLAYNIVTTLVRQGLGDENASSKSILDIRTVLRRNRVEQRRRKAVGKGSQARQVIFFTDLLPDDCMAMMQLLRLKANSPVDPIIVYCADFAEGKDEARVFELKLLIMVQMLGINLDVYVLNCTQPDEKYKAYPTRERQVDGQKKEAMERLCKRVGKHDGEVDLYILAATRGNLGEFVAALDQVVEATPEPTKQWRWHVTLCSDKNNMRGFYPRDKEAVQAILKRSEDSCLRDISKNTLFGRDGKCHPMTSTFSSFVGADFGNELKNKDELLVAALRDYSVLTSAFAIKPKHEELFGDNNPLSAEVAAEFAEIKKHYDQQDPKKLKHYAEELCNSSLDLRNALTEKSRNALHSYLHAGSEAPFGSQTIYLYEWVTQQKAAGAELDWIDDIRGNWVQKDDSTEVTNDSPGVEPLQAVQPKLTLKKHKDEEGCLKKLREALIEGILDSFDNDLEKADYEQHTLDGPGNLCYSTPEYYYDQAVKLANGTTSESDPLRSLYPDIMDPPPGGDNEDRLMVVFTDLEPDDTMAIAQLWRWKVEQVGMKRPPIVVFTVDFLDKDKGRVFELKMLVAALMLGAVPFYVVVNQEQAAQLEKSEKEGDKKEQRWVKARTAVLEQLAKELINFGGNQIDLYLLAPLRGVLADTVETLKARSAWPLNNKATTWKVSLYSGAFNLGGLYKEDKQVLTEIVRDLSAGRELVDLAKFPFFGGNKCHQVTASFSSFAKEGFAPELSTKYPLLASALKLLNDEHNWKLIRPDNLFEKNKDKQLAEEVENELPKLRDIYKAADNMEPEKLAYYAHRIVKDEDLFKHVKNFKKSTLQAFAYGFCDSPLCDQLVFLFEWLLEKAPSLLMNYEVPGGWKHGEKFTTVRPLGAEGLAADELRGIQPILRDPMYKEGLDNMREALNDYLFLHLDAMKKENAKKAAKAAEKAAV